MADWTAVRRATDARVMPNDTTHRAARPAPAPVVKPAPSGRTLVQVSGPRGFKTGARRDGQRPDDHVICVKLKGVPVPKVCVL
jgi:hypothetical protein